MRYPRRRDTQSPTRWSHVGAIAKLFDMFMNLDVYLSSFAETYGTWWAYAILFAVLFCETGLVIMPLLPGDSLLLTAGVLSAGEGAILSFPIVWVVCFSAVVIGDSVNYWVGRLIGTSLIESGRFVKREYVDRTAAFFEKHGGKTVSIARFFPIVRTFAPFMAGVGRMHYPRFLLFSVTGSLAWVTLFAGGGALFGNIPWVKDNLEFGVMFVLFMSLLPAMWHWIQSKRHGPYPLKEDPAEELAEIEAAIKAAEND